MVYEPPVPETAKGYYYYHDKKLAITLPHFPFSKEGGESLPSFTIHLWGQERQSPNPRYKFVRNMLLKITVFQK
jgi:hypothetical protein